MIWRVVFALLFYAGMLALIGAALWTIFAAVPWEYLGL